MGVTATVQASTVVVVRSPTPTPIAAEATVRLRGELVSAGFDVRVIDPPLGTDIRASLEEAAEGPEVEAVVAILGDASGDGAEDSAELWVIDRVTGKTVVKRVQNHAGSTHSAEVLSIRALELLRASFLEVALRASRVPKAGQVPPPPPPPTEVTRWTDAAIADVVSTSRWPSTWAIEGGGCVLASLEGVPPSVMPLVRVQRAFGEHALGRVTLAGFGTRTRVSTPQFGQPEIVQQFGLVEAAARFRKGALFQPFLSIGGGALHVSASGHPAPATGGTISGIAGDQWSLLADVGVGAHLWFGGRFELAIEGHAQGAQPYPVVRYDTTASGINDLAKEGRPTLVGSLTLLGWM
jgi:hypothetical protein